MGIYDREYYRRDGPSFLGSFSQRGQVCKWLIGINVVFFILQVATQTFDPETGKSFSPVTESLWLQADQVLHGQVWRLLSYAFIHDPGSIWHILFNMLFLWWCGSDMEDLYGPREFLTFYLISAFLGGVAYFLTSLGGGRLLIPCLGASGAVTAVMVLFAFHYPYRPFYIFFLLPVPAWLLVVFQVGQDAFTFVSRQHSTVAVTVHLGGAAFAFCYYKGHWRLMSIWALVRDWQQRLSRPRLRVYREEPTPRTVPAAGLPTGDAEEQLEAKLDAVLEKVARHGQNSLTENERKVLLRASELYKRRRT